MGSDSCHTVLRRWPERSTKLPRAAQWTRSRVGAGGPLSGWEEDCPGAASEADPETGFLSMWLIRGCLQEQQKPNGGVGQDRAG